MYISEPKVPSDVELQNAVSVRRSATRNIDIKEVECWPGKNNYRLKILHHKLKACLLSVLCDTYESTFANLDK